MAEPQKMNLTGALLVAMPGMGDPRFDRSVILICAHSHEGAMGLIVNKPAPEMALGDLLDQLDITCATRLRQQQVHFGGPVETQRGFVLHGADYRSRLQTLDVTEAFAMTATLDVLEDMAIGQGPEPALAMLGYAGWGPGQLESEIAQNAWLICDADADLVFCTGDDAKWAAALSRLGVSALTLSADAGRA